VSFQIIGRTASGNARSLYEAKVALKTKYEGLDQFCVTEDQSVGLSAACTPEGNRDTNEQAERVARRARRAICTRTL
jgi:hypothetical protein